MDLTADTGRQLRLAAEFWLVRHGESEVNVDTARIYRGANTWSELTDEAKNKARQLGESWKRKGISFDACICSPAIRTQQTCRYCLDGMAVWPRYELLADLVELRQGIAEGASTDNFQPALSMPDCPEPKWLQPNDSTDEDFWYSTLHSRSKRTSVPGSESQAAVFERARRCLEDVVLRLCGQTHGRIPRAAVFTHENVIKCLVLGLKLRDEPYKTLAFANLSVTKILAQGNRPWCWILLPD